MRHMSASYRKGLLRALSDPDEAAAYLNAALEDGSPEGFLIALRDVADSIGMTRMARGAKLNRESLYRMLSRRGNPQLSSLASLLDRMGLKLSVEVKRRIPA